ncbi:MAG: InlB B-repeat-containing protein [Clostridia bacterium]|nr:InlB B-repeat-containing protein [Clostridia bacterium]
MQKSFIRKPLSVLMSLLMLLSVFGGMTSVSAQDGVSYLYYEDEAAAIAGRASTGTQNCTEVADTDTEWSDGWYVVNGVVTISSRITVIGEVNLILADGATLNATAGITVTGSNILNIYGQTDGTGTLVAKSTNGAGIGGSSYGNSATITINGGVVNATGGRVGAGIGCGQQANVGTITINGGTVTATGGDSGGAGIGGGQQNRVGGTITINGGDITATGGTMGTPGIGAGQSGTAGTVTINGGTITAVCPLMGGGISGTLTLGNVTVLAGDNEDGAVEVDNAGFVESHTQAWVHIVPGPTHTHEYTYAVSGATITATCANSDGGHEGELTAALTIAPSASGGGTAELTGDVDAFGVSNEDITYQTKDSTGWKDIAASEVTSTGFYRANITVEGNTASVTYGVNAITKGEGAENGCDFTVPVVAYVGATITPELTLATGYEVKTITVKDGDTDVSDLVGATTEGFTMPDYNVTVDIAFGLADYAVTVDPTTNGTVTADLATAHYGDTVTLTVAPAEGYELNALTVNGDAATKVNDATYTFTMPAENATVAAAFAAIDYTVTAAACEGGTVAASAETANVGTEITLNASPLAGYVFDAYSVTKAGGESVAVADGKFTMPASDVTVAASFQKRTVPVQLSVTGADGEDCTAVLLNESLEAVDESFAQQIGDRFVLRVTSDDNYDFGIAFSTGDNASASIRGFEAEDYDSYFAINGPISQQTKLFWVTMPGVDAENLTISVDFAKAQTYTILYQPPTGQTPTEVWCKVSMTVKGVPQTIKFEMKPDANINGETAVWSAYLTSAFAPTQITFAATETELSNDLTDITFKSSLAESDWTTAADDGRFIVIGGTAKTAVASFVTDVKSLTVYDNDTATVTQAQEGDGVSYQIAVCTTDTEGNVTAAGSVTAPAAPVKEGFNFVGWRGFAFTAIDGEVTEKVYSAGENVSIRENTILNAVWEPAKLEVKLNDGTQSKTVEVTYGEKLTAPEVPAKAGYAFTGWLVAENVTEDGASFQKGSAFDFDTRITNDLTLTAGWKHVHYYTCYSIDTFAALASYQSYGEYLHVKMCSCGDVKLEAHSFDSSGNCACGYAKPSPTVTLKVSYGYWSEFEQTFTVRAIEGDRTVTKGQEASVIAPNTWGILNFYKWEYSTDGGATWNTATASKMMSFTTTKDTQLRALYVNPITKPQIELQAGLAAVKGGDGRYYSTVLYRLDHKLPDGYKCLDAQIWMGDNQCISYYELVEQKEDRATQIYNAITNPFALALSKLEKEKPQYKIEKREDSVLNIMSEKTLSDYMIQWKPINMDFDPIYLISASKTKGVSGSLDTVFKVNMAQKNNGNHWIYGMGYLKYQKPDGTIETIYTPALAATLKNIPTKTNTASGS